METRQILVNKLIGQIMNIYTRKKEIPSCIFGTFTVELLIR